MVWCTKSDLRTLRKEQFLNVTSASRAYYINVSGESIREVWKIASSMNMMLESISNLQFNCKHPSISSLHRLEPSMTPYCPGSPGYTHGLWVLHDLVATPSPGPHLALCQWSWSRQPRCRALGISQVLQGNQRDKTLPSLAVPDLLSLMAL